MIIHLIAGPQPNRPTGPYRAASLETEGFIHCSHERQVSGVLDRFFSGAQEVWGWEILPDKLTSPLKEDPTDLGESFPHIYGPINPEAFGRLIRYR